MPTPPGRPGRDHVARHQRDDGRDRLDERGDVEDEIAGVRVLTQLAVHPAANARVGAIQLVGRDEPRPHRPERVDRLPEQPLLVAPLDVARRHVVEDRVAEHVLHGARRADAPPALADDDGKLGLVVDGLRHAARDADRLAGSDHAVGHLREDDRVFGARRRACLGGSRPVHAARRPFRRVGAVVDAGAEDVAARPRQRRIELDGGKRKRGPGRGRHAASLGEHLDQRKRTALARTLPRRERRDASCRRRRDARRSAVRPTSRWRFAWPPRPAPRTPGSGVHLVAPQ